MATVRERILHVAQIAIENGQFDGTQVQMLCEQAKVSRTSFYREFRNVDDVIATLAISRWRRSLEKMIGKFQESQPDQEGWRLFFLEWASKSQGESEQLSAGGGVIQIVRLMYQGDGRYLTEITDVLNPVFEQGQSAGIIRTDVRPEYLSDWLLRQIWSLTSIPFPVCHTQQQLEQYFDSFIFPTLMSPTSVDNEGQILLLSKVSAMEQAIARIEQTLK